MVWAGTRAGRADSDLVSAGHVGVGDHGPELVAGLHRTGSERGTVKDGVWGVEEGKGGLLAARPSQSDLRLRRVISLRQTEAPRAQAQAIS
jgi:hypothetical protein